MMTSYFRKPLVRDEASATYFFVIFSLSLFLPSSINGNIGPLLGAFWHLGCVALICLAVWRLRPLPIIKANFVIGQALLFLLLVFTLLSPLNGLALGAIVPYIAIACVLSLNLRRVMLRSASIKIFTLLAGALLILGWGTVLGVSSITDFQALHYQMFSEELFEQMVGWYSKPVSVYATHSLSAFAYFALAITFFGLAHFERQFHRGRVWVIFGSSFALLLPFLASNSAIGLSVILIGCGFWYLVATKRRLIFVALLLLATVVTLNYADALLQTANSWFQLQETLSSRDNGFAGRYSYESRLGPTYRYLIEHNFWPIGLTFDSRISFGDNFIAEYVLRLTPLGYLLVLLMLYNFLRTNLQGKKLPRLFLAFFLIADISFPLLTSLRFIFMLPVLVIVWNGIYGADSAKPRTLFDRQTRRPPAVHN